jgi:hypothetical protein
MPSYKETRTLPCRLTDSELLARGHEYSLKGHALGVKEAEKKAAMKRFAEEIEQIKLEGARLGDMVRTKTEHREIEVEVYIDHSLGMARVSRLDTGETVETRPLTASERQMRLSLED